MLEKFTPSKKVPLFSRKVDLAVDRQNVYTLKKKIQNPPPNTFHLLT